MKKRYGHCSLCDKSVTDGEGRLRPTARRLTLLLLTSGHLTDITVCETCSLEPVRLPWLHALLVEAMVDGTRRRPSRVLSPAQAETERRMLWCYANDPPLGVLWDRTFEEIAS